MMELLDDVCHTKSCFGLFRDSVSFGARYVQGLHIMQHRLRNILVYMEIVLILMQDRCTIYMERTICLEISLATPDRTA